MENEKGLNYFERLVSILLLGFGGFTMARGIIWMTGNNDLRYDSEMYLFLDNLAPLVMWGAVLTVAGALIFISVWKMPKYQISKSFSVLLLTGGLLSSLIYFIIGVVGFSHALNLMSPTQLIILSAVAFILSVFGGLDLWQGRKEKDTS